jgi:biopolymer transport protein ExbD
MTPIPSPRSRRRARIEVIPLIDIIFFLLATFMMVSLSMVRSRGVPVSLPAAATASPLDREDRTTLSITEAGEVFLDDRRIGDGELAGALTRLAAARPDARVYIRGDEKVELGRAIAVLDEVRQAGIVRVAIETRPKSP